MGAMLRIAAFLFCLVFVLSGSATCFGLTYDTSLGTKSGPFVDKLMYNVIIGTDNEVSALLNDQIDLIGEFVDPQFLPQLSEASDVQVSSLPRNGYGYITIKTDKYPYNITNFRRALAFAVDKNAISEEVWAGLSEPQDSCVPRINPFSVEGDMPYHYYEANVPLGNELLNESGFADVNMDGWREAPNGQPFKVCVMCASNPISTDCCERIVATLCSLHVNAYLGADDYGYYPYELYYHSDYDIGFLGVSFTTFDVDWLGYEFWSEYADEPYFNFPCWRNATYDSYRDMLLHSSSYAEVYHAAQEMQKVWIHACPEIVLYENVLLCAHRTDKFEGQVNQVVYGVPGWWTNYRVHLKQSPTGPFGGILRWSIALDIDTFNFMATSSSYSESVLNELYDSLLIQGSDGKDILWLAESYTIQTHADNASLPEGQTKFTFDIIHNATWSDGYPLTAEDVAYTFNFYVQALGNPCGASLQYLTAAYATTQYQAVVEFSSESYWHLHSIAYSPIIPKHVFIEIGPENWNHWNPQPPEERMVTSGPFNVSDYVSGTFIELQRNTNYFYRWVNTTLTTLTSQTIPNGWPVTVSAAITAASVSTIVIFCSLIALDRHGKLHLRTETFEDVRSEPRLQLGE